MGDGRNQLDEAAIMAVLETVPDPEIPVLTITDLGIVRGFADDPPRVLITPDLHRLPGDRRDRADDPRGARRGRLRRRRTSSACCSRRGPPSGSASAAASGCKAYGIAPPSPSATAECPQCGSTDTESKSAASARPRARRNGAAKPAWSRSTASNATERLGAHHSAKLPSFVRKIGLRQRWRSLSASRTAASSMSTPRPGPSGTGR